jgi:polyhydroxybutyrate depolymerase
MLARNNRRWQVALLLVSSLTLSIGFARRVNAADPITTPGNHAVKLTVGKLERRFVIHVPPQYDGNKAVPIVLMLHGAGGNSENVQTQTGWDDKADEVGFLAVFGNAMPPFPNLPENLVTNPQFWNDGSGRGAIAKRDVDDVGYIKAMLDYVKGKFNVDAKRIFVTGFSSGASMTWRVGAELSDEVAAIAPVSGHFWLKNSELKRPVPVLFIIGTDDPLNPLQGGEVTLPWLSIKQYHPPI